MGHGAAALRSSVLCLGALAAWQSPAAGGAAPLPELPPALSAALARSAREAAVVEELEEICGRAEALECDDWRPRIYVGDAPIFAELRAQAAEMHAQDVATQFLPEVVLHENFLESHLRVDELEAAELVFVPYYARMLLRAPAARRAAALGALVRILAETNRTPATARFLVVHSSTSGLSILPKLLRARMQERRWHVLAFAGAWRRKGGGQLQADSRRHSYRFRFGHDIAIPFYIPEHFVLKGLAHAKCPVAEMQRFKDTFVHFRATPNHMQRIELYEVFRKSLHLFAFLRANALRAGFRMDIQIQGEYGKNQDPEYVEETMAQMRRSVFCIVPPGMTAVTRRLYEAIALDCIPVLTSRNVVSFHTLSEAEAFSVVWRPERNISDLPAHLANMSHEEIWEKWRNLRVAKSLFLYRRPGLDFQGPSVVEGVLQTLRCLLDRSEGGAVGGA